MEAINFKEANLVLAKDQPEYYQLPVLYDRENKGIMVYAHKLSWRERLTILFKGELWSSQLTFNRSFQPVFHSVKKSDLLIVESGQQKKQSPNFG